MMVDLKIYMDAIEIELLMWKSNIWNYLIVWEQINSNSFKDSHIDNLFPYFGLVWLHINYCRSLMPNSFLHM